MKNGVDISGLDKAAVLAILYNEALIQRNPVTLFRMLMGFDGNMTVEEAQQIIDRDGLVFRKLYRRKLGIDLRGNTLDPRKYDKRQKAGLAASAIQHLRETGEIAIPRKEMTEEERQALPPSAQKFLRRAERFHEIKNQRNKE